MRTLMISIAAACALAACGKDEAANTTAQVDEVAFEEEEETGDVTAIDAATNNDTGLVEDEGEED